MIRKYLAVAIAAIFGTNEMAVTRDTRKRIHHGRMRFRDAANLVPDNSSFPFRMPAGFQGDSARHHPISVEPCLIDAAAPPLVYGQPVLAGAANVGVRPFAAGDQSDVTLVDPWGFTLRPFPSQQTTGGMTSTIGAAVPPATGVIDVARSGYVMSFLPAGGGTLINKGDPVFVWCTASAGAHVQGSIEQAASIGNTTKLGARYTFNGPGDPYGNIEVCVNV